MQTNGSASQIAHKINLSTGEIAEALTEEERIKLSDLETRIERGLATFVDVGNALMEIRDSRLYQKIGYTSFEAYCKDRWQMTPQHAGRLITAYNITKNLEPIGSTLPANMEQTKPLFALEPDQQAAAWNLAVQTAPNGKVTGAHVQRVVENITKRVNGLASALETAGQRTKQLIEDYALDDPELVKWLADGEQQKREWFEELTASGYIQPGEEYEAVHMTAGLLALQGAVRLREKAHITINGGVPKALQMSESNEWYTPEAYIEAARQVMGTIDLDPASNPIANEVVKASQYYTINDDGLTQEWRGRVWLNPPYGRDGGESNQAIWSARLIDEYQAGRTTEAVLLVNAVTDRIWFQPLWDFPICFTDHRIRFYDADRQSGSPTHGNALIYLGEQREKFAQAFKQFGPVVMHVIRAE